MIDEALSLCVAFDPQCGELGPHVGGLRALLHEAAPSPHNSRTQAWATPTVCRCAPKGCATDGRGITMGVHTQLLATSGPPCDLCAPVGDQMLYPPSPWMPNGDGGVCVGVWARACV